MQGPNPIEQGESAIDVPLTGIDTLGTSTSLIKHWHLFLMPEEELAEISITFVDLADGTIDTAS